MIVKLELPYPPKELSPNAKDRHWGTVAAATADYKNACYLIARNKRQLLTGTIEGGGAFPLKVPTTAVYTFVVADKIRRDWVNLYRMFKAGEDALVEAGLIVDDNIAVLRVGLEVAYEKKACVRVTLEGAP